MHALHHSSTAPTAASVGNEPHRFRTHGWQLNDRLLYWRTLLDGFATDWTSLQRHLDCLINHFRSQAKFSWVTRLAPWWFRHRFAPMWLQSKRRRCPSTATTLAQRFFQLRHSFL